MNKRVLVLVDGTNLFSLQREELCWWIDPKLFLNWIEDDSDCEIVEAIYYAGYDGNDSKQVRYLKALTHMGYSVKSQEINNKPNFDCEITADMFCLKEQYDSLYLVTSNSNFAGVVKRVKDIGKSIKIFSSNNYITNSMRKVAGPNFVDFNDIREFIEKKQAA